MQELFTTLYQPTAQTPGKWQQNKGKMENIQDGSPIISQEANNKAALVFSL